MKLVGSDSEAASALTASHWRVVSNETAVAGRRRRGGASRHRGHMAAASCPAGPAGEQQWRGGAVAGAMVSVRSGGWGRDMQPPVFLPRVPQGSQQSVVSPFPRAADPLPPPARRELPHQATGSRIIIERSQAGRGGSKQEMHLRAGATAMRGGARNQS